MDNKEKLVNEIVDLEWEAFGEVSNEGGRASCQDNRETFDIMRKSQYLTWTVEMLMQFKSDFEDAKRQGWNMVTEKYARMMESNARDRYELIKDQLPPVSAEKKGLINAIAAKQVEWMEAFAKKYPYLANQARAIHARDDREYVTSYETYLKGELSTYSDKMIALYAQFILSLNSQGLNLSELTMMIMTAFYGYKSLEAAENRQKYTKEAHRLTNEFMQRLGGQRL